MWFVNVVLVIVSVAISSLWKGYVLTCLWTWFIVSSFGLPELKLAPAIGLSLVVGSLTHQVGDAESDKTPTERFINACLANLLSPLIALIMGAIVASFM